MQYNNKKHLSKKEKQLLKKFSEEQLELLEKLEQASQEFNIFSTEMEDMKGSVENVDEQIKVKKNELNESIVIAFNALRGVQEYYKDFERLDGLELTNVLNVVDLGIAGLQKNFKFILNEN